MNMIPSKLRSDEAAWQIITSNIHIGDGACPWTSIDLFNFTYYMPRYLGRTKVHVTTFTGVTKYARALH